MFDQLLHDRDRDKKKPYFQQRGIGRDQLSEDRREVLGATLGEDFGLGAERNQTLQIGLKVLGLLRQVHAQPDSKAQHVATANDLVRDRPGSKGGHPVFRIHPALLTKAGKVEQTRKNRRNRIQPVGPYPLEFRSGKRRPDFAECHDDFFLT